MKRSEQFILGFTQLMSRGPERFDRFVENLPPQDRENLISALDQLSELVAGSVAVQSEPSPDSKSASALPEDGCADAPKAESTDTATSAAPVAVHRKRGIRPKSAGAFTYDDVQTPKVDAAPMVVAMLSEIKDKLTTAPTLKSRQTLSELACELDVPLAKRDTRPRMAQKILLSLAERDSTNIEKALDLVDTEAKRGTTEAFMEYAAFITRDRNKD